jgi:energy-coupling factor transporter ATP-binding protein EcfA2
MTDSGGGTEITYRDLSEGEQQLLLVLGLLKFTAEDEALFLLDEPDTHLNPAWSTQYLDFLGRFIRGRASCHIVMATHDPLVFSRLSREQVMLFRRDAKGSVKVDPPQEDPRGMGVQAILTSDLFRLRSTLDSDTQRDLDIQRRLAAKQTLTQEEQAELARVNQRLHGLGFSQSDRDPVVTLFLKKWAERERAEWAGKVELSDKELQERDELAQEIADEIAEEQGAAR